jgi:16S rRNA (adenine1518-N6/adenine1519-N6)-dimethyltransferase
MTSPRRLLKTRNLNPNKALGQNFLSDPTIARRIVTLGNIGEEDVVLEIGAGLGALTIPLAKTAKTVLAVEKDTRFTELLKNEILLNKLTNVDTLEQNILEFNIPGWAQHQDPKIVVFGNLPYNISSQILIQLIRSRTVIKKAVVMLQKEPALRIMEGPGTKKYGRISVMMQYCAVIRKLMAIKSDQFFPKPKIDSVVLLIEFKENIDFPANDELVLFKVVKAAFGQRRKTLRNALKGSELQMDAEMATRVLEQSEIDPARRAESLEVAEFVRLGNVVKETLEK